MPSFRTELNYEVQHDFIKRDDALVFAGSCFAENLGAKIERLKYDVSVNPQGVIFNPISLTGFLLKVIQKYDWPREEFFYHDGVYRHFAASSTLCSHDLEATRNNFRVTAEKLRTQLINSKYLFLTFGTAYIYRVIDSNEIAGNCHKLPQGKFIKQLAEIEDLVTSYDQLNNTLLKVNKDLQVVITVSPVRHLRDGMIDNNRSKARLLEAAHTCAERFTNTRYWPAYELMMDDLRDYRFYKEDRIHPTVEAVNYIWEYFSSGFFSDGDRELNRELNKILFMQSVRNGSDQKYGNQKINLLEKKYKTTLTQWKTNI